MKKSATVLFIIALTLVSAHVILPSAFGQESATDPPFTVARLVVGTAVEDKEPVGVADTFSSGIQKVYCFLEAQDITEETSVNFVWYFGENEMANVNLPLGKSARWRTYSSKNLGGLKGTWKVELQDANGTAVQAVEFKVQE